MKIRSFLIHIGMLLMILLIFNLSKQDAITSNALSQKVTHLVKDYLPLSNNQIRDLAHIGLFFILGVICMFATLPGLNYKKATCFTLLIGSLTAFCDELVQLGSLGRAFEWIDMGKDMLGIVASIIIVNLIYGIWHSASRTSRFVICKKYHR